METNSFYDMRGKSTGQSVAIEISKEDCDKL